MEIKKKVTIGDLVKVKGSKSVSPFGIVRDFRIFLNRSNQIILGSVLLERYSFSKTKQCWIFEEKITEHRLDKITHVVPRFTKQEKVYLQEDGSLIYYV